MMAVELGRLVDVMEVESLRTKLKEHNQEHLLAFWDKLQPSEREKLVEDIDATDVPKVVKKFHETVDSVKVTSATRVDQLMQPPPKEAVGSARTRNFEQLKSYEEACLKAVAEGRLGVILLAGGQGTRLGVTYPKGMYDIGLPSGKTLYQLQAERILRVQAMAEKFTGKTGRITWYIMTSDHTHEATFEFFKTHNYFGLDPGDVVMFDQGTAPCFDLTGRILLASEGQIAKSPNGNGGLYSSLKSSGALQDMRKRGVTCIHVYGVDNVLVKVADPLFMGYCLTEGADCGAKVVPKAYADEPVGVVCLVEGTYRVVEYSEILPATAQKTDENGELLFSAGNICNHFFTVDFLEHVACDENEDKLPYHPATKKIPCIDPDQSVPIKPTKPNGIKLEKFVFDVFAFSKKFRLWEADRDEEFSPVKNADGAEKDTPTTARRMVFAFHKRLIEAAGGKFVDPGNQSELPVEISPLTSYAGEELEKLVRGKTFDYPCLL